MAKKQPATGFNPLGWMLTFSDLITLLLTFFVMLMAIRAPEVAKLKAAFGIFSQGSPVPLARTDRGRIDDLVIPQPIRPPTADDVSSETQKLAEKAGLPGMATPELPAYLQGKVKLRREKRGTVLTIANGLLFPAGGFTLSPEAQKTIKSVAQVLKFSDFPVSVEGHTDSARPRADAGVKSNWELSLKRALAVLAELRKDGIADSRLRVAALANSRPLASNKTPAGRAQNRRTEIVLLTGSDQP